jgi:hypothetical protein
MRSTRSPMAIPLHPTRSSALTGLRADVLALAERRTHELRASTELTPTAATLRRQALVLAQFDACGAALYRLRSAVRELSPSAP